MDYSKIIMEAICVLKQNPEISLEEYLRLFKVDRKRKETFQLNQCQSNQPTTKTKKCKTLDNTITEDNTLLQKIDKIMGLLDAGHQKEIKQNFENIIQVVDQIDVLAREKKKTFVFDSADLVHPELFPKKNIKYFSIKNVIFGCCEKLNKIPQGYIFSNKKVCFFN